MPNAARLSGVGTFFAFEFDDNTNTSFSVSAGSTVYASNIDETETDMETSETISSISVVSTTSFSDGRSSHSVTGLLTGDTIVYAGAVQGGFNALPNPTDFTRDATGFRQNILFNTSRHVYKGSSGSYTINGLTTTGNPATVIAVFRNLGGNPGQSGGGTSSATTYPGGRTASLKRNELMISFGTANWDGGTITAPSNFTMLDDSVTTTGTTIHLMAAYRIVPSDGSYTTGTFSGTNAVASDPNDITLSNLVNYGAQPPVILRVENNCEIKLNSLDTSIINEVDTFDNIPTSNLELHLDASSGFTTTTLPTSWQDLSGNNRHMRITGSTNWDPYNSSVPSASDGTGTYYNLINLTNTIEVGQTAVIPEIRSVSGLGTSTYELYNLAGNGSLNSGGNVLYNSVTQSPVVGPIGVTLGTREFFRFGGTTDSIQHTTLRIPPQQVPYTAVLFTHIYPGSPAQSPFALTSSSINNERASVLNVPFDSSNTRLGVCDGTGSASAYTGVTGTSARTVIVGVKVPASPSTSHTIFSYGQNITGKRFNIRLQSTGQIRIQFGSSYVQIPTTAIDDLNDFQLIAITVPASGTVSDVRVWLNGNEVTSQLTVSGGTTAINTSSANNVTIGGSSNGPAVEYLDDSVITKVMIYSTVLSDLEIKQIYQSIIPDIYPFVERAS